MMNPNINKYVTVEVLPCGTKALYRGATLPINDRDPKAPGKRRMWLRFSICGGDVYYLRSK